MCTFGRTDHRLFCDYRYNFHPHVHWHHMVFSTWAIHLLHAHTFSLQVTVTNSSYMHTLVSRLCKDGISCNAWTLVCCKRALRTQQAYMDSIWIAMASPIEALQLNPVPQYLHKLVKCWRGVPITKQFLFGRLQAKEIDSSCIPCSFSHLL